MQEFDQVGLALCRLQGELFEQSRELFKGSSAVFIRRFMNSFVSKRMDEGGLTFEATSIESLFDELDNEYGCSDYGRKVFEREVLYWMGYLYRYWAYVFKMRSKQIFKIVGAREMASLYFPYHSLDPYQAVERILEAKGVSSQRDVVGQGVELLRRIRTSGRFEYAVVRLPQHGDL